MEGTCDEMLTLAEASCHFAHPTSRGARLTYLVKPRCYTCSLFLPALTTSRLSTQLLTDSYPTDTGDAGNHRAARGTSCFPPPSTS